MNLFSDEMRRDPYPLYRQIRSSSPVFYFEPAGLYMLLDHDGVRRALTDHESFSSDVGASRGVSFEWLLFMDPPRHTRLRAIVSRAFTPRSVANLEPRIRELVAGLLDRALQHDEIDLVEALAAPLPMMVIAEMVGLPVEDWPRLRSWSDAIIGLGNTIIGSEASARAASDAYYVAQREMQVYLGRLLAERRASPSDDLLGRLCDAEIDGERLGEAEILRFVQLLIAAGTETTTNLIDNTVLCLLDHPHELAAVRDRPELLPAVLEETLRYRAPVQAMFRATRRDVEVGDKTIPAGKFVIAIIGAANRDPKAFPDPDRFDPRREGNGHIAFGHGIHFCLGAPLARLEGRLALGEFLSRVAHVELASPEPWPPRDSFHVHGPSRLRLRLRVRD